MDKMADLVACPLLFQHHVIFIDHRNCLLCHYFYVKYLCRDPGLRTMLFLVCCTQSFVRISSGFGLLP